jgi:hypothetical protein
MFDVSSAGILKQSRGARNRVEIGLSYWPAWLHRMAGGTTTRFRLSLSFIGPLLFHFKMAQHLPDPNIPFKNGVK